MNVGEKTTSPPTATTAAQTGITVTSAGLPTTPGSFVRIDSEVLGVTAGAGTTTWTVTRGQLGTVAAAHAVNVTVSALSTDWYGGFTGVPAGSTALKVTYRGKNCGNTMGTSCTAIAANPPQQTVKNCNWTVAGAAGCAGINSTGWVSLPAPPAQPQGVGSTDFSSTWTVTSPAGPYIGTGANEGQVRILVHTQRWTAPSPTPFSTRGDQMKITYDAP